MILGLNLSTSPEEKAWRERTAAVMAKTILPAAVTDDLNSRFRKDIFRELARERIPSLAHAKAFGGGGELHAAYYACLEEMARASAGFAVAVSVTNITQGAIAAFGTQKQTSSYLPRLTSGEWLGAFSLSEPQSGSDAAALKTKATRVEGGYRLNGTKLWCSNAAEADLFLVIGRTSEDRAKGITAFLVPKTTPGFRIGKLEHKMGLWASSLAELIFEDAFIPEDQRLGSEGEGFSVALSQLDGGRIAIGTVGLGIALECIQSAFLHISKREKTTGTSEEGAKQILGDYYARALAIRSIIREAAKERDAKRIAPELSSTVKLLGSDLAMEVSSQALEMIGPSSVLRQTGVERYFRDAKALQIVEGTNQIQRLVLSRQLERALL